MITGYEIKKEWQEEVLVLHLNYDSEYGTEFYKRKSGKNMKKTIQDFIKEEKIKWNGNKILLVFGGLVLGTVILTANLHQSTETNYAFVTDDILPSQEINLVLNDKTEGLDKESEVIQKPVENIITPVENNSPSLSNNQSNSNNDVSIKHETTVEKKTDTQTNNSTSPKENSTIIPEIKKEPILEDNTIEQNVEETPQEIIHTPIETETKTTKEQQITVYRTNGSVITLPITDYLIGVVSAEMPASFPVEALKAQSVIARTYALKRLESGLTLTDSSNTQGYKDEQQLRKLWGNDYDTYYQKIKSAVEATDSLVVKYQGNLIDAVYHSTSNGKTESSVEVWGNSVPYLVSVDSSWDKHASTYTRTVTQELSTVLDILGINPTEYMDIEILTRNESGRISSIKVGNNSYSGVEFRNLLGLRSTDFDIVNDQGNLIITTRGYGHGVGMSQYGASGMAKNGYNYKEILNHYYPGTYIEKQ